MAVLPAATKHQGKLLVIACGALAREMVWLQKSNLETNSLWQHMELQCLDAELHNRPKSIAAKLRDKIEQNRHRFDNIFIGYADCGTGGEIDRLLEEEGMQGVERLPGAHCYAFYAGQQRFAELAERELGTFYLTDFLVEHFERLVIKGLKLDRYPELREQFFAHYKKLVYLSQRQDQHLQCAARDAADFLNLDFVHHHCGYGELGTALETQILKLK